MHRNFAPIESQSIIPQTVKSNSSIFRLKETLIDVLYNIRPGTVRENSLKIYLLLLPPTPHSIAEIIRCKNLRWSQQRVILSQGDFVRSISIPIRFCLYFDKERFVCTKFTDLDGGRLRPETAHTNAPIEILMSPEWCARVGLQHLWTGSFRMFRISREIAQKTCDNCWFMICVGIS